MTDELFIEGYTLLKPLSKEETFELFKSSKFDEESRNKIIEHNIRLVLYEIQNKFYNYDYDKKDLVSVGILGLVKSVDTFELSKGYEFTTYAVRCIDNELFKFIRNNKKTKNDISFEEVITVDEDSVDNFKLEEILRDKIDFRENIEKKEVLTYLRSLVNELNERDKKIIMLYFGFYDDKCYTTTEISRIINLSQPQVSRIISKIVKEFAFKLDRTGLIELHLNSHVKKLREIKKLKTIYEYFSEYTEDEVNYMISKLSDNDKKLLKLRYGNNLYHPYIITLSKKDSKKFYGNLVPKMKKILADVKQVGIRNGNPKVTNLKTIYEYFNNFTEDEIDSVISELNADDKKLLTLRYGDDLHHPHDIPMSREDTQKFYGSLVQKIKRRLEKLAEKNIRSGRPKVNKNKIIEEDTNNKLNVQSIDKPNNQITDNINVKLSERSDTQLEEITKKDCIKLLELLKTPSFFQMISTLSAKEAIIISLKLGYVDGKYFRNDQIATFLEISEQEVRETISKIILSYKENINQFLDSIIDESTNQSRNTRILKINKED